MGSQPACSIPDSRRFDCNWDALMKNLFAILIALLAFGWINSGCEPAKDSYRLGLVFTADCKGYIEDCG